MTEYIYRYTLEMQNGATIASLVMTNQDTAEERTLWQQTYADNRVYLHLTETFTRGRHMLHLSHPGSWMEEPPTFELPF